MARAGSTFDGSESPVSESGAFATPGSFGALKKVSGHLRVVTDFTDAAARAQTAYGSDQFSRVWCSAGGAAGSGENPVALTRIQGNGDGSCMSVGGAGNSLERLDLVRIDDDGAGNLTFTILDSQLAIVDSQGAAISRAAGDAIELRSVGTSHKAYCNNVLQISVTDATYTGGQPGPQVYANSNTQNVLDAWEGGDVEGPVYVGSASTPTDGAGATNTADPTAVTGPSASAGDLVIMVAQSRAASLTQAISNAGGQDWQPLTQRSTTNCSTRIFWCQFNGTWSSNPSVSFGSTTCNTVVMHVIRPSDATSTWAVDVAESYATYTAATTVTITGQTTTQPKTATIAVWVSVDDNTWGGLTVSSGAQGWVVAGQKQNRNTSGSDQSMSSAVKIQMTAGATGDVTKQQLSLGGDAGARHIVTFYEVPAFTPVDPFGVMGIFGI